jgi:branched-chain amino acid transport system permease protein
VVGSLAFGLVLKGLQQIRSSLQPYLPIDVNWVQYIAFGTLLIVILMVRPDGLLPEKPSATLAKSKIAALIGAAGKDEPDPQGDGTEEGG